MDTPRIAGAESGGFREEESDLEESLEQLDALILGSGQAAKPLALALGSAGWKTAVIERQFAGGSCVNYGCTPTKTMIASARAAWIAGRSAEYGIISGPVSVDLPGVRERKRLLVESFRGGVERRLESASNVQLIYGEASFLDRESVLVQLRDGGERRLSAKSIFINTGCRPAIPDVPGLSGASPLDSTSIMELERLPDHLLILGGGYIGLEFGQMFRRFGSRVTIIERSGQLLSREDADVGDAVADILREDGIEVLLNTRAVRVDGRSGDEVRFTVDSSGGRRELVGSHLLTAAGRVANTGELNLAAAGLSTDERGFVGVNEKLETKVPGIYALGDVNGGPQFTHIAYDDYRIVRTNLLERGNATTTGRLVPYTVYIDPQLGRVGISEKEARRNGMNVKVAKIPMTGVARALETSETRGFMKAVLDAESGQILGCAILGLEGGEIMSAIQIAMIGGVTARQLADAVFAHPTLMEGLNSLFSGI